MLFSWLLSWVSAAKSRISVAREPHNSSYDAFDQNPNNHIRNGSTSQLNFCARSVVRNATMQRCRLHCESIFPVQVKHNCSCDADFSTKSDRFKVQVPPNSSCDVLQLTGPLNNVHFEPISINFNMSSQYEHNVVKTGKNVITRVVRFLHSCLQFWKKTRWTFFGLLLRLVCAGQCVTNVVALATL
jgi:hypothetical protein